MCECSPAVKTARVIEPHPSIARHAVAVTLTICDCDRLWCPINGCGCFIDVNSSACVAGHRFGRVA